jgi:hypothetical protein
MECFIWKWLYYWALIADGIIGILTVTLIQSRFAITAAKKYAKCRKERQCNIFC